MECFERCFVEVSSCSLNWQAIPSNGKLSLVQPSNLLNLRWNGTEHILSTQFMVELHRQSSPETHELMLV